MRISDWSSYVCSSDLLGKGARSARIEADRDDRLIALRVIALLRVDPLFAADHHLAAQHFERRAIAFARGIGDDPAAHRHAAGRGFARVGICVDHAAFPPRALADPVLQCRRILTPPALPADAVTTPADNPPQ